MGFDDLTAVKDDMVAFIAGHGLRRMKAFVPEDVATVLFEEDDVDGWKDFVEHAKAASAPFITMSDVILEPEDVSTLIVQLRDDRNRVVRPVSGSHGLSERSRTHHR